MNKRIAREQNDAVCKTMQGVPLGAPANWRVTGKDNHYLPIFRSLISGFSVHFLVAFLHFTQKSAVLFADLSDGYREPVRTMKNVSKIDANTPEIPFLA